MSETMSGGAESPRGTTRRRLLLGGGVAAAAAAVGWGAYKFTGPGGRVVQGRSRARPVPTLHTPPPRADVVIIGGGIIGAATAFELARRGLSVVVCEKGAVAGEASGRAVGEVGSGGLDLVKLPLINRAKQLWAGYNALLGQETGYRRNGTLSIFETAEQQAYWEDWLASVKGAAPEARLIGGAEVARRVALARPWRGAFYDPSDGGAEPKLAAPAIAMAAMRRGAVFVAPCAVRGIETAGGRVSGVVTEKGPIRASRVVLAGGCWSSLLAGTLGLQLPYFNMFSMCREVDGVAGGPPGCGGLPDAEWRRQIDGKYTISVIGGTVPLSPGLLRYGWKFRDALMHAHWDVHPNLSSYFFEQLAVPSRWKMDEVSPFERLRILQPSVNGPLAGQAVTALRRDVPAFRAMRLGELWSGALVAAPDNMPTMSEVESLPGLVLATGFTYGITMGPAAGEAVAQLVAGERPTVDLHPYRFSRYTDGSPLRFTA